MIPLWLGLFAALGMSVLAIEFIHCICELIKFIYRVITTIRRKYDYQHYFGKEEPMANCHCEQCRWYCKNGNYDGQCLKHKMLVSNDHFCSLAEFKE